MESVNAAATPENPNEADHSTPSEDVEGEVSPSSPSSDAVASENQGFGVAVAVPLNDNSNQLIYEAREQGDDPCCAVAIWWLKPFLNRITKRNWKWVLLFFVLLCTVIIVPPVVFRKGRSSNVPNESTETEVIVLSLSGLERVENITNIIAKASKNELYKDTTSSQGKAFLWLLNEDKLEVSSSYPTLLHRYALMVIYYAFNGDLWTEDLGYGSISVGSNATHECDWKGITCSESLVPIKTNIPSNGALGTIPEEIAYLSDLQEINFSQNSLEGSIPESFYSLTKLNKIDLHGNLIQGTLSSRIGQLQSLRRLLIRTNHLNGTLPSEIGTLKNLTVVRLYSNRFSGNFPDFFANNSNLIILNFGENEMSGPLPPSMGNLKKLLNLYFYYNDFTGTVPSEWDGMTSLKRVGFWNNKLSGVFPRGIPELPEFVDLSIGRNNFWGPIPFSSTLEELWIYGNNFNESIPPDFGIMKSLKIFSAWNNSIQGPIPEEMGNLTSLITLELSDNKLSGSIPESLGKLGRLITMNLSRNKLTGDIPSILTSLPVLNELSLYKNNLTNMPIEICNVSLNVISSDCAEVNCTCCTCCYGEDDTPTFGEC